MVEKGKSLLQFDNKKLLMMVAMANVEAQKAQAYLLRLTNDERPEDSVSHPLYAAHPRPCTSRRRNK